MELIVKQYAMTCGTAPAHRAWITVLLVLATVVSFLYVWLDPPPARAALRRLLQRFCCCRCLCTMKWAAAGRVRLRSPAWLSSWQWQWRARWRRQSRFGWRWGWRWQRPNVSMGMKMSQWVARIKRTVMSFPTPTPIPMPKRKKSKDYTNMDIDVV